MRQEAMSPRDRYRRRRTQKRWRKVMTVLCALVVFCTTYALILPAITLEKGCRIPEHTHDDGCYTQVTSRNETTLACTAQVHSHEASCQNAAGELVCGYADFVVHVHEDGCYDETGALVCPLPEIRPHTHTEDCYVLPQTHTHDESCYTATRGALLCTLHAHGEDCWTESQRLICGQEESQEHAHTESCWQPERVLTCGVESDHVHTDECYAWEQVLTCGREENADAQPELVCPKEEIILHRHTPECRDAEGNLICGQRQILQHQHGEECFQTRQIPVDTETLTCTDENHVHTPRCYGQWELTCGMEEHTHGPDCTQPEDTKETQATEETEAAGETAPEGVPTGLPVLGTAYTAPGPRRVMAVARIGAADPAEGEAAATDPVDVTPFIVKNGTKLEYTEDDGSTWKNVEGAKDIPGNAQFKITVKYEHLPIEDLRAAGGRMTYTLPDIFREAVAHGYIHGSDHAKKIGTIEATGNTATVTFYKEWLDSHPQDHSVIDGDFYVRCKADLTKIPNGGDETVKIGGASFQLHFKPDLLAQYADVTLEKTVVNQVKREDGKDYLEYTLKVTAGPDGCPEVKVTDAFTQGQNWVDAYIVSEGDADKVTVENDKKTMTWNIGTMQPNEVQTLNYKVRLTDGYTGGKPQGAIQNNAKLFSKNYERKEASATFKPNSNATLRKGCLQAIKTLDGGKLELTYYVWVTAQNTNYPLRDVVIKDALDGTVQGDNLWFTKQELRQYIYYKQDSFTLYEGGKHPATEKDWTTLCTDPQAGGLQFNSSRTENGYPNGAFEYHVGTLMPNESRTLVYKVVVEPGFFAVAGNNTETIINRASIYWVDKQGNTEFMPAQKVFGKKEIARKAWSRKVVGNEVNEAFDVPMTGTVYEADGTTPDAATSFTVPAGSHPYQVLVNEAGDWDLSSAQLTDTLSGPMTFVGYVRVDAFHINNNAPDSKANDQAALNHFANQTPAETFWVKIEGKTTFAITPGACSSGQNHAYRLTYYAMPNTSGAATVNNTLTINGQVGYGGKYYPANNIRTSTQVTVTADHSFGAQKYALFYEPHKGTGDYPKGTLYWAIQVNSRSLPGGFALKDTPAAGTGITGNHIRSDSLVGVYTGASDLPLSNYTTLADLQKQLTAVDPSSYTAVCQNGQPLTVTLLEEIRLANQSLYVLVKTEPEKLPQNPRDVFTYSNGLQTSSEQGNWADHGSARQTLYAKPNIFKELADVITSDGVNINYINGTNRASYDAALLQGKPGKYVGWLIHLNYAGTLNGTYRVEEQIPQGMEIAYIRMYWYGPQVRTSPSMAQISGLGGAWTEKYNTSSVINNTGTKTNYYYVNGQTAIMDVTNLVAGGGYRDDYAVELQIVCKLTDPEVLLGGQKKTFENKVRLFKEGTPIDSHTSPVTLSVKQMQKETGDRNTVSGAHYPFVITLNQEGIDLMPKSDKITLVDELGENLTLDPSSITVRNSKTNDALDKSLWTPAVQTKDGKQILTIVLPDNLPLTISYTTTVNAPPNTEVTVTNKAHWLGYEATQGSSVNEQFRYGVGGTAGGTGTPKIIISKVDGNNTNLSLKGAEFRLTQMELQDGELKETEISYTGTTGDDGKLTFGEKSNLLHFDKVYKIQETKAPPGYVLDDTPRYVLIAERQEDNSYPDYSAEKALGVTIHYASTTYLYPASNHKGEIVVHKAFQNADGSTLAKPRNGTYHFGLFTDAEGTNKVKETQAVFAYGNQTVEAKFTDVALDQSYYVYELNDQGQAIRSGAATVSGIPFVVSYTENSVMVTAKNPSGAVTVTNRINYAELPQTGGGGISAFRTLGTTLVLCAAGAMLVRWCRMAQYRPNEQKTHTRGRRRGRYEK